MAPVRPAEPLTAVLVDAAYRDGWAGIAGVFEDGSVLFSEAIFVTGSTDAERRAVGRALEVLERRGLRAPVWTDCRAAAGRRGRVRWVDRSLVKLAHREARRVLLEARPWDLGSLPIREVSSGDVIDGEVADGPEAG